MREVNRHAKGHGRGQTTAEYAIVFGVVVAALVAMQIYVKRGVNARLKDASDSAMGAMWTTLKKTTNLNPNDMQYEPYYTSSSYTVEQTTGRDEFVRTGGGVEKANILETANRTGHQTTGVAQ